ncbi:MAG: SRPBCC domain-containing protein [Acetobacteraceae bacterium]
MDGGEPDETGEESRVEIDLRQIDTGTELTFTHSRLQTEASRASHGRGWNGALDKLARHFGSDPM